MGTKVGRPKKPEKYALSASCRACLTKSEYATLGRFTRLQKRTISVFVRELILRELELVADAKRTA